MTRYTACLDRTPVTLGYSPDVLCSAIAGERWERWRDREPELRCVEALTDLDALRGPAADLPLGALVRLAALDGGDDELAAVAVVHRLQPGTRSLCRRLRDLSDDIEPIVVGELWAQIRTFPWQRRTHSYAANLLMDTRAGVLRHLQVGRWAEPLVLVGEETSRLERAPGSREGSGSSDGPGDEPSDELTALLAWAREARVVSHEDEQLLAELIAAGHQVMRRESGWAKKGACSELAVSLVAQRRGVSCRTLVRRRNRIVDALRQAAQRYLNEVA